MIKKIEVVFLHTPNIDTLTDWYRDVLDLEPGYQDGHWNAFQMQDGSRFALDAGSPEPSVVEQQAIMVSFRVDDLDAAVATLSHRGVEFYPSAEQAIYDVGPARVASFKDPEGRWMQLTQPKDVP